MTKLETGKKYEIIIGQEMNGKVLKEEMKLEKITEYKNKEIYIFIDESFMRVPTYYLGDNINEIDWDFMEDIMFEFGD